MCFKHRSCEHQLKDVYMTDTFNMTKLNDRS